MMLALSRAADLASLWCLGWPMLTLFAAICFLASAVNIQFLRGTRRGKQDTPPKVWWRWVGFLITFAVSVLLVLPPQNLVNNPGFEDSTRYWGTGYLETMIQNGNWPSELSRSLPLYREFPDAKRPLDYAEAEGELSQERNSGDYSFKIHHLHKKAPRYWSSLSQQVAGLTRDGSYAVGFAAKAAGLVDGDAYLVLHPDWKWKCSLPSGTYEWRLISCPPFNVGGLTLVEVRFVIESPSTVWIDDVIFYERDRLRRVLCGAPDFIRSPLGWCPHKSLVTN